VIAHGSSGAVASAALAPFGKPDHVRLVDHCTQRFLFAANTIVMATASSIHEVASCVSAASKANRLTAFLVQNDIRTGWLPYVFHQAGLRTLRNLFVHQGDELPNRVLGAWANGTQEDVIADAAVINDRLVVRSCTFEEHSITFDDFPALTTIPNNKRSEFVFEEDGLLIYWPSADVHLDLDDVRFANDPVRRAHQRAKSVLEQIAFGTVFRKMREGAGWRQGDVPGVSERQIRRIESGDFPGPDTLEAIAKAFHLDVDAFLEVVADAVNDEEFVNKASTTRRSELLQAFRSSLERTDSSSPIRVSVKCHHQQTRDSCRIVRQSLSEVIVSRDKLTPGSKAPASGQYEIIGPRGGRTGVERTVVKGETLPPTPHAKESYRIADRTNNGAGRPKK
jgi:transcriptional regulator with XRE-family HTH domain